VYAVRGLRKPADAAKKQPARPGDPEDFAKSVYWQRVTRDDFTFFHTLRVRWAEVDRQDVVFNGNYFL
jgi:hypothetical protein